MSNYVSSLRIPYYVIDGPNGKLVCKSKLKAMELSKDITVYYMSYAIYDDGMKFVSFKSPIEDFNK